MSTRQYGIEGWGIDIKYMDLSPEKIAKELNLTLKEVQGILDMGEYENLGLIEDPIEIAYAETTVYFLIYSNLPWEYYWNMDLKNMATEEDAKQYFWEKLGKYSNLTEEEFKKNCERISDLTY